MKKICLYILLFAGSGSSLFAQYGSSGVADARSMSLARTYNASSRGLYSIGINPSNLMLKEKNTIGFSTVFPVPVFSAGSGSNFLPLDEINYFFGGVDGNSRLLTEADKSRFNKLLENGGLICASASAQLLALSYRDDVEKLAFAFSINDFAGANISLPQSAVELALSGNTSGKSYNFNDADVKSWWIRSYTFSLAAQLINFDGSDNNFLNGGISIKYIRGFSYIGTERVNTSFATGSDNVINGTSDVLAYSSFSEDLGVHYNFDSTENKQQISLFPSPSGSGFGIDLGFSSVIDHTLTLSLAVTDIGSIKWNKHAAEFSGTGSIYLDDLTNKEQRDSLKDNIVSDGKFISEFKTGLPTALRMGASYLVDEKEINFPGSLLFAIDYNQGFNNLPGNSKKGRVSIGAEWKPMDWFPYVRTGFSVGGATGFNWGLGLGVNMGFLELDFATSDMQSFVAPNSSKYISAAFSSRWKF